MKIIIPFKTPSINHLYYHIRNYKVLTKQARELQETIRDIVVHTKGSETLKDSILSVDIKIHERWFTKKDGSVANKDVANREKFMIDSIFRALEIDDKVVFKQKMEKVNDEKREFTVVEIQALAPLPLPSQSKRLKVSSVSLKNQAQTQI